METEIIEFLFLLYGQTETQCTFLKSGEVQRLLPPVDVRVSQQTAKTLFICGTPCGS